MLEQRVSHLSGHQTLPEGLVVHRFLGPIPGVSDLVGLGWGPRIGISDKFPGNADAAGPRSTL